MTDQKNQRSGTDVGQFATPSTRQRIVPMEEMMHGLGLDKSIPGGPRRAVEMANLMQSIMPEMSFKPLNEQQSQSAVPLVQEEPVINKDPYEGDHLTEEMLERLESTDWDGVEDGLAEAIASRLLDKDVPDHLSERALNFFKSLEEKKMLRIVGGKVTRVNKRVGSKAAKERRLRRKTYKTKKAHIKLLTKKRMRKAGAKMKAAKTARKHAALSGKKPGGIKRIAAKLQSAKKAVKSKASMLFKKNESSLVNELHALLLESQVEKTGVRDEILVNLGEIISCMEQLFNEDVMEMLVDQYHVLSESYCNNQLQEGRLDEAGFVARCTPLARIIARCCEELEDGKNEELPA